MLFIARHAGGPLGDLSAATTVRLCCWRLYVVHVDEVVEQLGVLFLLLLPLWLFGCFYCAVINGVRRSN